MRSWCRPVSSSHVDIMQRRLELDVEATEEGVRTECVNDLAAAAAALQAAVTTVVAAAEQPARRQPTPDLVAMCFEAVSAMLGALLQWPGLSSNEPMQLVCMHGVRRTFYRS
jgi:hypothetical protein